MERRPYPLLNANWLVPYKASQEIRQLPISEIVMARVPQRTQNRRFRVELPSHVELFHQLDARLRWQV